MSKKLFSRPIITPPLKDRNKILDLYYQDIKQIDQIQALIRYKSLMHALYKKHNPWIKPVFINEKNWFKH